jgi:hypothetical protein
MGFLPFPFDNWISNGNAYIYNKWLIKPAQICFYSKRPHTITKMNDNINVDTTIADQWMPVVNWGTGQKPPDKKPANNDEK